MLKHSIESNPLLRGNEGEEVGNNTFYSSCSPSSDDVGDGGGERIHEKSNSKHLEKATSSSNSSAAPTACLPPFLSTGNSGGVFAQSNSNYLYTHNNNMNTSTGGRVWTPSSVCRVRSRNCFEGKWCSFLLAFFVGTCFGLALFPLFITLISMRMMSNDFNSSRGDGPYNGHHNGNGGLDNSSNEGSNGGNTAAKHPIIFTPVKFEDVAGVDEAKAELTEIVDFLKFPQKFTKLGARMPKGLLLVGAPGSGKTMLARAVATEANVPYICTSGSEFIEIYVGQGAKRMRELFAYARSKQPCIIFIDELDAVGAKRSGGIGGGGSGGQREHDQTLNQLLVEMDGFNSTSNIIILAATNRIDVLDSALLRPGRFDRIVTIPLPDVHGRELILRKYLAKVPLNKTDVYNNIRNIAKVTSGFSGAEIQNMVNEAALLAARKNKEVIGMDELNEARDKISMGPERRSIVMSDAQKQVTAYHEAGHAIVAFFLQPNSDPIHKATIISRGNALGFVEQIPPEDRYGYARTQLEARLAVAMGGRCGEEIKFGKKKISNGASSDILMATKIAYKMVCEWGMSDKLGPLNYNRGGGYTFFGGGGYTSRLSGTTTNIIENEVKLLVSNAEYTASKIIRKHRKKLDELANALLEFETLGNEQITHILDPTGHFSKQFNSTCSNNNNNNNKACALNVNNNNKNNNNNHKDNGSNSSSNSNNNNSNETHNKSNTNTSSSSSSSSFAEKNAKTSNNQKINRSQIDIEKKTKEENSDKHDYMHHYNDETDSLYITQEGEKENETLTQMNRKEKEEKYAVNNTAKTTIKNISNSNTRDERNATTQSEEGKNFEKNETSLSKKTYKENIHIHDSTKNNKFVTTHKKNNEGKNILSFSDYENKNICKNKRCTNKVLSPLNPWPLNARRYV